MYASHDPALLLERPQSVFENRDVVTDFTKADLREVRIAQLDIRHGPLLQGCPVWFDFDQTKLSTLPRLEVQPKGTQQKGLAVEVEALRQPRMLY